MSSNASTPPGCSPSPAKVSEGDISLSITVTLRPCLPKAAAKHAPVIPAPMMTTSGSLDENSHRWFYLKRRSKCIHNSCN